MTIDSDAVFPLLTEYNALARRNRIDLDIPGTITDNLSPMISLRPYQVQAIARFRDYMADEAARVIPIQLLFEMATGSGKTVVMAALILDLYARGYRNFVFFVNSTQIVEKTRANFIDPNSSKYLFSKNVRIADARVELRSVSNFDEAHPDAINIHFTTIQGLHARMLRPRENDMTPEDFEDNRVVLISDEAHHMSAETRALDKLSVGDREARVSWESTVNEIMSRNPENILLEFTATADLDNPAIQEKYRDRLIYQYDLKGFRADGYSKDIELRQASLPPADRMLQAVILSQYRRKVAEGYGIRCKPVILMKSQKIAESKGNEALFHEIIAGLDGDRIEKLRLASEGDGTLEAAFQLVLDERGMTPDDFAQELKLEFAPEKIVNVNDPKDLEARQILLNSLEDRNNEIRVIFAVDKLNEGWDVLNLFDIVRLYDKRDGKGDKVGKTTMSEAQLIGRGARYFPFASPDDPDAPHDRRKFDRQADHRLRVLEQMHYHCSHNPRYIDDIRRALRNVGLYDETERKVVLKVKDSFRRTELYRSGYLWANERLPNGRGEIVALADYMPETTLTWSGFSSGRIIESGAFDASGAEGARENVRDTGAGDQTVRRIAMTELGADMIRFAMDGMPYFHFENLVRLFPRLSGRREFITSADHLGSIEIEIRGPRATVEDLPASSRLEIARFALSKIQAAMEANRVDHIGSREFRPRMIAEILVDRELKIGIEGERGRSWKESGLDGIDHIDLHAEDWHVFDDSYGTDQEKYLIRFIHDNRDRLRSRFDEFYLVRNEKLVTIYSFDEGRAFEPDFILFLRRKDEATMTTMQVFIEPKGAHLAPGDEWKERFLAQINEEARLATIFQGQDFAIHGLPFHNSEARQASLFQGAFDDLLMPSSA